MAVFEEISAAVGCLTALERPAARASRPALAGGLAFYPVVGLALGALAAGVATATETVLPAAAGGPRVPSLGTLNAPPRARRPCPAAGSGPPPRGPVGRA